MQWYFVAARLTWVASCSVHDLYHLCSLHSCSVLDVTQSSPHTSLSSLICSRGIKIIFFKNLIWVRSRFSCPLVDWSRPCHTSIFIGLSLSHFLGFVNLGIFRKVCDTIVGIWWRPDICISYWTLINCSCHRVDVVFSWMCVHTELGYICFCPLLRFVPPAKCKKKCCQQVLTNTTWFVWWRPKHNKRQTFPPLPHNFLWPKLPDQEEDCNTQKNQKNKRNEDSSKNCCQVGACWKYNEISHTKSSIPWRYGNIDWPRIAERCSLLVDSGQILNFTIFHPSTTLPAGRHFLCVSWNLYSATEKVQFQIEKAS